MRKVAIENRCVQHIKSNDNWNAERNTFDDEKEIFLYTREIYLKYWKRIVNFQWYDC